MEIPIAHITCHQFQEHGLTSKGPYLFQGEEASAKWLIKRGSEALQSYLKRKDELGVMNFLWGSLIIIQQKGRELIMEELHDIHQASEIGKIICLAAQHECRLACMEKEQNLVLIIR